MAAVLKRTFLSYKTAHSTYTVLYSPHLGNSPALPRPDDTVSLQMNHYYYLIQYLTVECLNFKGTIVMIFIQIM